MYPNALRKEISSNLNLFKLLKQKNYNFSWVTNNFINCSLVDFEKCHIKKKEFLNFYLATQFLQQSFVYDVIHKIKPDFYGKSWYKKNDAIKNFIKNFDIKKIENNNNFIFIHDHSLY